jgi:hypothetical protein
MEDKFVYILFALAISVHNIEEALWLPAWSKNTKRFMKPIEQQEFNFAVLVITIFALLATSMFIMFPEIEITKYIYFGFLGAMIINVIFPHFLATIVLRKYAPGLISGLLLILPINGGILYKAMGKNVISFTEIFISSIITGAILLISLPILFRIGKIVKDYKNG